RLGVQLPVLQGGRGEARVTRPRRCAVLKRSAGSSAMGLEGAHLAPPGQALGQELAQSDAWAENPLAPHIVREIPQLRVGGPGCFSSEGICGHPERLLEVLRESLEPGKALRTAGRRQLESQLKATVGSPVQQLRVV